MTVQLFCGDCLDILPTLPDGSVDAVITDPPYPGLVGGFTWDRLSNGVAPSQSHSEAVGTPWGESLEWASEAWRVVRYGAMVFCSHHCVAEMRAAFPDAYPMGMAGWYKRNAPWRGKNVPRYDLEFIWLLKKVPGIKWDEFKTMLFDVPFLPAGCFASERILQEDSKKAAHPCQKPLELMHQLLVPGCDTVLDPFMGTGTTGVACVQTGRSFIGIELDKGYFEIAKARIEKAQAELEQASFLK